MSLLDPITRPLDASQAAHLLRRTTFGASPAQIRQFTGLSPELAAQRIVADQHLSPPPPHPATGDSWVDKPWNRADNTALITALKSWWVGLMGLQEPTVAEKMTLFWQNHFVSTLQTVPDPRFVYLQNTLLRRLAMGNFRTLVIEITKDPTMQRYLNGNSNVVGRPNQNYARELQELFTIGRGNYNEDDVQAAARVLTGWRDNGYANETNATIATTFDVRLHDTGDKQFSAFYQNTVIRGRNTATAGDTELGELVDMILRQAEVARFICRKLYRWFINHDITPTVEQQFIEPLANIFRRNYEIKPVLSAMFQSRHFYDTSIVGCMTKTPIDLVVGTMRAFQMAVPNMQAERTAYYQYTNYVVARIREMQMDVMDQPSVFGWRPFYDTGFYDLWISSNSLTLRNSFSDTMITGNTRVGAGRLGLDSITVARQAPDPAEPDKLVDYLADLLFATKLSQAQKDYIIDEVLTPGGIPRYEWTTTWNSYTANPNNATARNAVKMRLDSLLTYMFRMAEYQVC